MTTVSAPPPRCRPARSRLGAGLVLAVVSAVIVRHVRGAGPRPARHRLERRRVVLVRIGLAALVVLPFGLVALRGRWGAAAPQRRGWSLVYGAARGRRRPVLLLLGRPAHAGRAGAAHRVHRARRGRGLAVAAPRAAPGPAHAGGRRRSRPLGPGAGARPASRAPTSAVPACCGRWARWSAARRTSSSSADDDNGLPPLALAAGGLVVGTVALGAARPGRAAADAARATDAATYAGHAGRVVAAAAGPGAGHGRGRLRRPASPPAGGWARGWRRSWRCSRSWPASAGPGCCSTSCPAPVQLLGGLLILAGVVAVKLGERSVVTREPAPRLSPAVRAPRRVGALVAA